ncbi:related to transposase [Sporisorium reilianum f. sp. reilianum]|uniref:Related to transposase n=1 Tax=Sporisorium reilianum f. sp. reilianum TaxID=72559 RepID=A0A2N8U9Q6_9BASI|nr:related to transposase [Sporisorium reilianum f. sp. reilianum]
MARPTSKRSKAARAASAAERDDKEARLQQAVAEHRSGQHGSIRQAADTHNVSESTLRHRLNGRKPKKDAQMHMQSLPLDAEDAVLDLIRRCACSGFPLAPVGIRKYANTVARSIPGRSEAVDIGRNWLQAFLLRHPSVRSCWSRCLENARLNAANEGSICTWFDCFAHSISEFNISTGNVYNMDETGFMFGQGGSERVIVPAGNPASRFKAQPGSRESATVIECIGSGGQVLPPLIITKGKRHTIGEHRQMEGVPATWRFSKSPNGWTTNELAIEWLETVFDPNTKPSAPSAWRLLILDGHGSHVSTDFLNAAWRLCIAPLLLPPHSTHLMQPLDVSIFGPLTAAYRRLINNVAQHVAADISKAQFVSFYAQARGSVLTQMAARKAFSDTGMTVNPDPERVLNRLPGFVGQVGQVGQSQTFQPLPLQELAIPRSHADANVMLNAFRQEPDARDANRLKQTILQALNQSEARVSSLEAELTLLRSREEQSRTMAKKVRRKDRSGDRIVLSKDMMITRDHAESQLVAKKPAIAAAQKRHRQKHGRHQEEQKVAPPPAAADDGDDAVDHVDEALLASAMTLPPPPTHTFLDELNNVEPLDTITDNDPGGFGFFDTVPVASSSRVRL